MANETAMAQSGNQVVTDGQLIENTVTERLLGKISEMRKNNLTEQQKDDLARLAKKARRSFELLALRYFGIGWTQIQELSDQEVEALFLLVYERAKKTAVYMKVLAYGIPIVGWISIRDDSDTIKLTDTTRKLRSMLRNSFNPVKIIRSQI